jgi:hypothetical protein
MKKPVSSCPFDGKVRKAIISALLTNPKTANWPIEMKLTKTLAKECPDPDFWFFLAKSFKFQTLMSLLSQKDIIFRQMLEYTKQKDLVMKTAPEVELADKKLGEDIMIKQKKQTLMDFIN